jgi:ABC-2 type transport system permease protein
MTTHAMPSRAHPPGRAFGELVKVEGKLALRVPIGLVLGVCPPGPLPGHLQRHPRTEKASPRQHADAVRRVHPRPDLPVAVPHRAGQRADPAGEQPADGRAAALLHHPAPQSWLLAAQVVINLVLAVLAIVILMAGGALLFGVHPASQMAGFVVSVVLATAAMFAIGLLIAAIAPSTPVAGVAGTVLLYRCCSSPACGHLSRTCRRCCSTSATTPRSAPPSRRWRPRCRGTSRRPGRCWSWPLTPSSSASLP